MVSSVLAQAILNQKGPDIVGSFRKGQEFARGEKTRQLSSQALKDGGGEALDDLIGINPEVALAIGETIRARSAKDINDFIRDAGIAERMISSGDDQGALQFAQQRRNAIALRGGDTSQTDQILGLLSSGKSEEARQSLLAFTGSLEKTKETSENQNRSRLLKDLDSKNPDIAKSARIGLKLDAGAGNLTERQKLAMDSGLAQNVASNESMIAASKERGKLLAQGQAKPQVEAMVTLAKERSKQAVKQESAGRSDKKALNVYTSAVSGLLEDFEAANTGNVAGLIPAISADDRVLEASINIMRPVVKGVVRDAGEGTFTDQDQKLIDELLPTRRDTKEIARRKIERLDAFVKSKLSGADQQAPTSSPASQGLPSGGIKFLGFE